MTCTAWPFDSAWPIWPMSKVGLFIGRLKEFLLGIGFQGCSCESYAPASLWKLFPKHLNMPCKVNLEAPAAVVEPVRRRPRELEG